MLKNAHLWGRKCRGRITPGLSILIFTLRSTNIKLRQWTFLTLTSKCKLHSISRAPLKPNHKMYTLRSHLIPSLVHYLTFNSISLKSLSASDTKIRFAVRQWPKTRRLLSSMRESRLEDLEYCSSENRCRSLESIECRQWWHSPDPMRMSFCLMLRMLTAQLFENAESLDSRKHPQPKNN